MRNVRRLTDLLVFVGPSGCGKSTIIQKLQAEFPDVFRFSISHTTRAPRDGEVSGREYHYVSKAKFESLLASNAFIEYTQLQTSATDTTLDEASSGGGSSTAEQAATSTMNYYGTSKAALHDVLIHNKVVLMDTDVLGAINIRRYCEGRLAPVVPVASTATVGCDASSSSCAHSSAAVTTTGGSATAGLPNWDAAAVKQEKSRQGTMTPADERKKSNAMHSLDCKIIFIAPPSMRELARRLRARQSESEETLQRRLRLGEDWMAWAAANRDFFDHHVVNDDLEVCYAAVRKVVLTEVVAFESAL